MLSRSFEQFCLQHTSDWQLPYRWLAVPVSVIDNYDAVDKWTPAVFKHTSHIPRS